MFSARILTFVGFLLHHHIRFSSAEDGLFTDELLSFNSNNNIDSLQNPTPISYFLDPTNLDNSNSNDGNVNTFDVFSENGSNLDSSPDLFTSDTINWDSMTDPATNFDIVGCGSPINNGVLRKNKNRKTRIRRGIACGNPNSNNPDLKLTLPSLNQIDEDEDPLRPATPAERDRADKINILLMLGEFYIQSGPPKDCRLDQIRICSSGDMNDIKLEGGGETYSVANSRQSKSISSHSRLPLYCQNI